MHEFSLVRTWLQQVDRVVADHGGRAAVAVCVEVGPLSGVEPLLVKSAFEQLSDTSSARGATLSIDEVPLTAKCSACDSEFEVIDFRFACPACGSGETQTIRGDAFRLMSVTTEA